MNKCIWYILCWLSCGRGVLKRKLKIGRLEVFLNAYAGICKFGKVRKTKETLADFSEKSKRLKKKKKKKIFHFASALFSKDMLRIVKGFAPWILIDCFKEKFLYPLECREVPSGS